MMRTPWMDDDYEVDVPSGPELRVFPDAAAACRATADLIVRAARKAIAARGRFVIAVSGGTAPQPVYELLATTLRDQVEWEQVHLWYSDERCVPPDHDESNHGMVQRLLLAHVDIPDAQVHRLEGELMPRDAARRADAALKAAMESAPGSPFFDVMLIGVGQDGHTASLFPGAASLAERDRRVIAVRAPQGVVSPDRLTLTLPALSNSCDVVLLATGPEKRRILHLAAEPESLLPVSHVTGADRTVWIVDAAAWG